MRPLFCLAVVVSIGLRVLRQVTPDPAVWLRTRLPDRARHQHDERERDRQADHGRQGHEHPVEELHVDHLRTPVIDDVYTVYWSIIKPTG